MKRRVLPTGQVNSAVHKNELDAISRYLSFVLRHGPDTVGVKLDANGWASIEDVIRQSGRHGRRLSPELIRMVAATSDKQRFAISSDGQLIRANQGHSIATIDVGLTPVEPPEFLFHGTAQQSVESIMVSGIRRRSRNHVHLSADVVTAVRTGMRHGKPVVLRISARAMYTEGHEFFLSINEVWLTEHVPPRFIEGLES